MPDASVLPVFAAATLALLVVPGPAVLYIVARSVSGGRRAGLVSVLGVHVGTLVHVVAAVVGLSAVLASSAVAFTIVKYAGAAYLVYLGLRTWASRRQDAPASVSVTSLRRTFWQGALVNVTNPKTALFFLAFLPQFVDPDATTPWLQALVLGLLFVGLGVLSDGAYALLASGVWARVGRRPAAVRRERLASGGVLVGLGVLAAVTDVRRPATS